MGVKNATIGLIAREAGCSPSTVSRVISGYRKGFSVRAELEEKILALAQELNYRPNPYWRSLRTTKTRLIAIFDMLVCGDGVVQNAKREFIRTIREFEYIDAGRYAAGDIAALSRGLIAECAYVQGVVGLYVKGLFVVDKIGHGHIGVGCVGLLKSLDIVGKLLFVKQGVDRREAEPFGRDARRQLIKTVHRTRRIFDDEAYGIALLQLFDMALYLREPVMGDDVYAGGIVLHEDAAKPVYERFSVHRNERFGLRDTLPGKPGTFAGGDNGIFHGYIRLEVDLV